MAGKSATVLRLEVEAALAGRVAAPFQHRERVLETAPIGIAVVDALTGGLPRGALTEVFGPAGSGKTSLLLAALAARTHAAEVCAMVDGRNAFDPASAEAAGVRLEQLLWVRCRDVNQALRVTDLLIQGGGFGLIALDLSDVSPKLVRHIPLNVWFRMRRAVENTQTILVAVEEESNAKTCASLVLRLERESTRWSQTAGNAQHTQARFLESCHGQIERVRERRRESVLMRQIDAREQHIDWGAEITARFGAPFTTKEKSKKRKV
jgi:recombination protein RecA